MANPRIEEVEEDIDDPEEMDLDAFDFARPKGDLQASSPSMKEMQQRQQEQEQKRKHFQCIYPVYFDSTRSREEGRRVKKEDAVPNPLAREIADALAQIQYSKQIQLSIVFEPQKTHPKDWANPGRVRVLVKNDGKPVSAKVQNKYHLYKLISEHLKAHPTNEEMPAKFMPYGMQKPKDGKAPKPAIPRGFKMGTILPMHSPALTGGGVSDNFLKDMMGEMGGQLPPGMEGMANMMNAMGGAGGQQKPKKIKVMQGRR
ncbi:signal recognition particle, SRP19 subunit [Teratosphaeria nubilosa]|uniref:Signal recognition particle, SRP19 subunit n=1 Tax=Teratosphaeria nubilosa TaxID=161662 RepID=A0A6G1L5L9_9PEZI|nr:signal recognition particle, SRP19 subunit [Teratosphaeria nubilosa]